MCKSAHVSAYVADLATWRQSPAALGAPDCRLWREDFCYHLISTNIPVTR